jgi:uncharacterized protein (TIGR03084 family)
MTPTSAYGNLIFDLADEHAGLDEVVAPLSEVEWSMPTPAAGWSIRDSVLHLALTDHVAALAAADPPGFDAYRNERRSGVNEFEANRSMPAVELLARWRANRSRLLDALRGLDARHRITWFGPPMSAMSHASARLMETWAHGQDVRDALGLAAPATSRLKHIAHLGVRARAYSYSQHGLPSPSTDMYVCLAGPDGAEWTWGEATAPDRVLGDAADFCLVVVRRRHLDDTDLVVEGLQAREWLLIAQAYAGPPGSGRGAGRRLRAGTHRAKSAGEL